MTGKQNHAMSPQKASKPISAKRKYRRSINKLAYAYIQISDTVEASTVNVVACLSPTETDQ
jgi:hypothetical protein